MSDKRSYVVAAAIIVGCTILSLGTGSVRSAQPATVPPTDGQYQIAVSQSHPNSECTVFIFQPSTGHCWFRTTNFAAFPDWKNMGSPVKK